jgi:hypothetical protein
MHRGYPATGQPARRGHEQVTGLLNGPRTRGVRGDAQDVHAAGLDLHYEPDVQALEEHSVNMEESRTPGSRTPERPGTAARSVMHGGARA